MWTPEGIKVESPPPKGSHSQQCKPLEAFRYAKVMDPLSTSVSCLAILSTTIHTSRALLNAFSDIKHASRDSQLIANDVRALQPLLSSLEVHFQSLAIHQLRPNAVVLLQSMKSILENCNAAMTPLLARVGNFEHNEARNITQFGYSRRLRWAFFGRHEAQDLSNLLNTSKSTLQLQLQWFMLSTMWPSISIEANEQRLGHIQPPLSGASMSIPALTTSTVLDANITANTRPPLIEESPMTVQQMCQTLRQDMNAFKTSWLSEVRDTVLGCIQPQTSLLTRISQIQADHSEQLSRLGTMFSKDRSETESEDASTEDLFLDCVSRFTVQEPGEALATLSRSFTGSATYYFERNTDYCPEQYSNSLLFTERMIMVTAAEANDGHHSIECFFYYASKPRQWCRVHLLVLLEEGLTPEMVLGSAAIQDTVQRDIIPSSFKNILETMLQDVELFDSVTEIFLPLLWHSAGHLQFDFSTVETKIDHQEMLLTGETQILKQIREIGCPQFSESEIATIRYIQSNIFLVSMGSSEYIEHKAPFVHAGQTQENGFHVFVQQMLKTQSLSNCSGVAKFAGVVLDDSRTHVKGFLCEPVFSSLDNLLSHARNKKYTIPQELRLLWARQIVETICQIHSRGVVIGRLRASLSQDMNMVLNEFWNHLRSLRNADGRMPPENRNETTTHMRSGEFSQKGDIFQLGMILWRLSEQMPRDNRFLCDMAGCQTRPYYSCRAAHKNPISLPFSVCSDAFLHDIIERCRKANPSERPTAQELVLHLENIEDCPEIPSYKAALAVALREASEYGPNPIWCDDCWVDCVKDHFHCCICADGDFDLCSTCVADGVHCFDRQHKMYRVRFDASGNNI